MSHMKLFYSQNEGSYARLTGRTHSYVKGGITFKGKIHVQFLRSSTFGSQLNSNILNLNIIRKDNIICVLWVYATMCLNSIGEPNMLNLRNCI